jgi:hypothetical protein
VTPDPSATVVVITLRDVYDALVKLDATVAAGTAATSSLQGTVTTLQATVLDHETRLRGTERRSWAYPATIATALVNLALAAALAVATKGGALG